MAVLSPTSYPGVSLREFDENDNKALYRIFVDSRNDLLNAVAGWDEAQRKEFLHGQFRAQQDQYRRQYPTARFDMIVADGKVVGNFYVAPGDDEILLVDINLLPGFRNQGIGRALLQDLIDESERSNKQVSLNVMQGNPAIHLYERMGFKSVGAQDVYRRMVWRPASAN